MDYTVYGILQARILEWVAFSFSRGSSQPRDPTQVSHIAGGFFTSQATGKPLEAYIYINPWNTYIYLSQHFMANSWLYFLGLQNQMMTTDMQMVTTALKLKYA